MALLAKAAWVDGPAAANRSLALLIGGVLMASGGLVQLLPDSGPRSRSGTSA
ncbi:GIVxVP protein [Vulcanococcus limneticus]|uniref:GIVxVP protein n=1 Tax=Vulcanococcus limneticus TaxID=2170428 RepID=UPI00398BBD8D